VDAFLRHGTQIKNVWIPFGTWGTKGPMNAPSIDPVVWHDWHPVSALEVLGDRRVSTTMLLDVPIAMTRLSAGNYVAWDNSAGMLRRGEGIAETTPARVLPTIARYGHLWACLGDPVRPLFELEEASEPDRRSCSAGSFGVHVSGMRAIENFLDMAHFPFVHTGILGVEPYTEVLDYKVTVTEEAGILATDCRFRQPRAAVNAIGEIEAKYVYVAPRPLSAILFKTNPLKPTRNDLIALFVQPVSDEECVGHQWLCMLDTDSTDGELRRFQQMIFGQDKPILENQQPRRLPLDPRAELPCRADASSAAYRRWLRGMKITHGVIPPRA
jgi:phenylpropionate dioxygenase-like ring-hydroxylating dioxygenase large terminal subunit